MKRINFMTSPLLCRHTAAEHIIITNYSLLITNFITLLTLLGFNAEAAAQAAAQAKPYEGADATAQAALEKVTVPQLVVTIAIDQLRSDRLEAYLPLYGKNGLRRLLEEGKVFVNASHNFLPVDRASGTASLMTGSTPYYNGVTGLEWLDRSTLQPRNIVSGNGNAPSPQQMVTSTIGDELKISTGGLAKVFAFAPDAERAILSAGHAADAAVWTSDGKWHTSAFYAPENQWIGWYTRQYVPGENAEKSVTTMAVKCVEQSGITQDDQTDLISIAYTVEPNSLGYSILDNQLTALIDGILHKVPKERVLFVITGTGATEEENGGENERYRIPTGKFYINRTANLLNMYLGAVYGSAQYVETYHKNQLFLNRKLIDRKNINFGDLLRLAQELLLQMSGVRNVYTSTQLMTSDNEMLQRIRNGYNFEKSGDLLIDVAPGWELVNEDTHTSSTSRASYIPFPIIFFGMDIKHERIHTPVTVDRIAPTVARAIRIRAPNACSAEPLF